ncbi:MAG TPA: hypothetical protein VGJ71_04020 [Candidatus Limnocylindrales bacterium]|jgi:hypothetical protein
MKMVGRLFGVLLLGWFATMAVAASVAMQRKRDAPPASDPDADSIELRAIFGPLEFASTAAAFRGGSVECWFGGGTIDLRGATLAPDGAYLRTTAVFGGASILVPDGWIVETHISGIGGAGDARGIDGADVAANPLAPKLVIEGPVAFGGFAIMSSDPRPEAAAI